MRLKSSSGQVRIATTGRKGAIASACPASRHHRWAAQLILALAAAAIALASAAPGALGQPAPITATFTNNNSNTSANANPGHLWSDGANWDAAGQWPSGVGAVANFNGVVNSTVSGSHARTVSFAADVVVSSLNFNLDTSNVTGSNKDTRFIGGTGGTGGPNGDGGTLTFKAASGGNAFLNVTGGGNSRLTMDAGNSSGDPRVFIDGDTILVANVANTAYSGATGALNWTGSLAGDGGFTKTGDGLLTFGSAGKEYAGPTVLAGGRTRMSFAARPANTSSFTISAGGQLTLISNNATYDFGGGPLNLNGFGPTSGPFAQFGGAIRPDTNLVTTITNNINVQTAASIALFGNSSQMTLSGVISGGGRLHIDAHSGQPENLNGTVVITGANDWTGGLTVRQNIVRVSGANATLGMGDIVVDGLTDPGGGLLSTGRLEIEAGVLNAIADSAIVTLTGDDGAGGTPIGGILTLGSGIDDLVGGIVLGGITQTAAGTYGSSASGADHPFDQYFAGLGVLRLEPSTLAGDYDGNGVLDARDYVLWRKTDAANTAGYDAWKSGYGTGQLGSGNGGGAAFAAVPEPAGLILLASVVPLLLAGRRRETAL